MAAELKELEAAMADPDRADDMDAIIERYGEVQARFEELGGYALEGRAREVLAGLSFSQEMMDGDVGALSGGWKMRVALARILLMRPDAMLLDEPSNHLDLESLIWLERFLKGYDGALLMTSHDREFMNRIVTKVVEIDGGALTTYSGDYEFYEQQRALNEKQQQAQFERQQAMLAKEIKFIERFKARASHAAQVQSRVKKLDKIERVEPPKRRQTVAFEFPPAPRSGDDVVSLKNVHKRYGNRSIYEGLDFAVRRKERWCVMGVNGAGKSTLLKLVAGSTEPDDGTVALGGSVKMGYFAQHAMDLLDGERTVFQSLEDAFPQAGQGSLRALAGCFGFSGDDVEKKLPGAVGRREGAAGDGQDALRSAELPGAGRAHQPSRHRHQGDADHGAVAIRRHHAVRLARPAFPRRAVQPGARTDARRASISMAAATRNMWRAPARKLPDCAAEQFRPATAVSDPPRFAPPCRLRAWPRSEDRPRTSTPRDAQRRSGHAGGGRSNAPYSAHREHLSGRGCRGGAAAWRSPSGSAKLSRPIDTDSSFCLACRSIDPALVAQSRSLVIRAGLRALGVPPGGGEARRMSASLSLSRRRPRALAPDSAE